MRTVMFRPTVFEFRNYRLRPGGRQRFETLFEREFVESQEALGSLAAGTFRVLGDPDRFVWIRCFETMESRARALDGFYTSALWRRHRDAANAEIRDSDNVLQLNCVAGGMSVDVRRRAPVGVKAEPRAWFLATTYFVAPGDLPRFAKLYERAEPWQGELVASFVTDPRPNSYPRLPVRNDSVFLALSRHTAPPAAEALLTPQLEMLMQAPPHLLRLRPTPRSLIQ
jgi:hypothetical protein